MLLIAVKWHQNERQQSNCDSVQLAAHYMTEQLLITQGSQRVSDSFTTIQPLETQESSLHFKS